MKARLFVLATALLLTVGAVTAEEDIDAVIDFEGLAAGTVVHQVSGSSSGGPVGPIAVWGNNPELPGLNACVIFDSDDPTGVDSIDRDLGTPNEDFGGPGIGEGGQAGATFENNTFQHNLLIIDETLIDDDSDGLVDNPDDADLSDNFLLDFSTITAPFVPDNVTVYGMTLIDVEADEPNATIRLYDALDTLLEEIVAPSLGDNGLSQIVIGEPGVGISGVAYMLVNLGGSGAIDDVIFLAHLDGFCGDGILDDGEECDDGNSIDGDGCSADCTIEVMGGEGCTPGYWKQIQHFGSWVGHARDDSYSAVFGVFPAFGEKTLYQALRLGGGGERALARHAVAALLNSSNADVSFAYSTAMVIQLVQDAYASGEFESTKNMLADENERGCPLARNDAVYDDRAGKIVREEVNGRGGMTRRQTSSSTAEFQSN